MGGFLGGLSAAIGGAGRGGSTKYGQQILSILEERRPQFVQALMQEAANTTDPQAKSAFLKRAADAAGGGPLGTVMGGTLKAIEGRVKNEQAVSAAGSKLSGMIGGTPQKPSTVPGPTAPGQPIGSGTQPTLQAAAQPATSPVQLQSQAPQSAAPSTSTVIPPVGSAPAPQAAAPAAHPLAQDMEPKFPLLPEEQSVVDQYNKWMSSGMLPPATIQKQYEDIMQAHLTSERGYANMTRMENFINPGGGHIDLTDPDTLGRYLIAGGQYPYGMAMMNRVQPRQIDATNMSAEDKQYWNLPPDAKGKFTVNVNGYGVPAGQPAQGWAGVRETTGETGVRGLVNVNRPDVAQPLAAVGGQAMAEPYINPHLLTLPGGQMGFQSPIQAQSGIAPTPSGGVNPAFVPTVNQGIRSVTTTGPNGEPQTQLVPITTSSSKGNAGAASPTHTAAPSSAHPSIATFERPLTPEEHLKAEQMYGQYDLARERAQSVMSNIHLLDSLIDSGKMQLTLNSTSSGNVLSSLLSRGMTLTPSERSMVTNFNSLLESVNLIRGPLGATGFRGPEAFAALQSQKGNLLARPDITRGVLDNFVQELQNQLGPLAEKLHKNNRANSTAPKVVNSKAEYDSLPSGAIYLEDGHQFRKP